MIEIKEAADLLKGVVAKNQEFVLFLLRAEPAGTRTAYSSTLERPEALRFLIDMVVSMRNAREGGECFEPRVMGSLLDDTPDALKITILDMLGTLEKVTASRIRPEVWRDMLLAYVTGMAHDQGITRADFERCALECAQEEWSTPDTEGRAALDDLLKKTKPQGG